MVILMIVLNDTLQFSLLHLWYIDCLNVPEVGDSKEYIITYKGYLNYSNNSHNIDELLMKTFHLITTNIESTDNSM